MWIAKLIVTHDCIIGNRCRKFTCVSFSLPISHWSDGEWHFQSHRHTIEGTNENVEKFLAELKADPRVEQIEISGNSVVVVEKRERTDIPTAHHNPKLFFTQPVFVNKRGEEKWEVAAFHKKEITAFISALKSEEGLELKIEAITKVALDNIYFPKLKPNLSPKQNEAYQLALEHGYYSFPRKANLQQLAKIMKVTVATYQEHLRKAESKIMPQHT